MTKTIFNAKARRDGGRITVNGTDSEGAPLKVVGVDEIDFNPGPGELPVATDKNGDKWVLAGPA